MQVSVYDTINPNGGYSLRVRRLGEFHPTLGAAGDPDCEDLNDALYGEGGQGWGRGQGALCGQVVRGQGRLVV